jgi:CheY-like chemotaxis protein
MNTPTTAHILLVEDEPLWMRVLHRRLTAAGYQVECATNAEIALDWLATAVVLPDLILTDLFMPVADGYDLCAGVRSDPRLAHLPIVVMSSSEGLEFQRSSARFGVFRFLIKPVRMDDVIATVDAALTAQKR